MQSSIADSTAEQGTAMTARSTVQGIAETVGQAQILTALGQAFTLEGLFGEADQQALPDPMEVEDEAQAMDGIDADEQG